MSKEYDEYLGNHASNIKKGLKFLHENKILDGIKQVLTEEEATITLEKSLWN